MSKKILNVNLTYEAKDYPYGRLRTSMFYSLDFHPKKGFRAVTQSLNPKTGRMNKPHPGTYSFFKFMYENTENGHFEFGGFSSYGGFKDIRNVSKFIAENFEALQLTREQVQSICGHLFTLMRGNTSYSAIENKDALLELVKPTVELFVKGINTGNNIFAEVKLDVEAIEKLKQDQLTAKVAAVQEARFVSSAPVALSSLAG